jgi:hypothetical protein
MQNYICITCGNQFVTTEQPALHCPICEDEQPDPVIQLWEAERYKQAIGFRGSSS